MSLLCNTRTILNNYTASATGEIERYSAVEGKEELFSTWYIYAHATICVHTRWVMLKRTFKAIHQDHGRVVQCRTIAISHRTIPRYTLHTYVRRVMVKKNGDTAFFAEHTSPGSRFESNAGLLISFTNDPKLNLNVHFLPKNRLLVLYYALCFLIAFFGNY